MRYRERDYRQAVNSTNSYQLGLAAGHMGSSLYPSLVASSRDDGYYEVIEDIVGDYEGDNPCYHYSEENSVLSPLSTQVDWTGTNPGTVITATFVCSGGESVRGLFDAFNTDNHAGATSLAKWSVPDYSSEGWYSVYPQIKAELNSINSIYELKDFRELPRLINQTSRTMDAIQNLWKSARLPGSPFTVKGVKAFFLDNRVRKLLRRRKPAAGKAAEQSLAQIVTLLPELTASHFLNWEFAFAPLASDIAALQSAASNTKRKIDRLLEQADGEIQHAHWRRNLTYGGILTDLPDLKSVPIADVQWVGSSSAPYAVTNDVGLPPVYAFNVRFSYTFPDEARRFAYELGRLDALGLQVNAGIIWRATRWTFVLDWFLKIGSSIDRLAPHHLSPVVNIHGGTESMVYEYTAKQWLSPWRAYTAELGYVWQGVTSEAVAQRKVRLYVRKRRIPSLLGIPKVSDFSTIEKLLGLALVASSGTYSVNH